MIECEVVEFEPQEAAVVHGEVPLGELADFFGRAFTAVIAVIEAQGLTVTGPPFGFYPTTPDEVVVVEAGFPVSESVEPAGDVVPATLPGGPAVTTTHVGPFEEMERTYQQLQVWMSERGLVGAAGMWETYLTDPEANPDPATWRTGIVWPLASEHI